jgi:hypothetical protein
MEPTLSKYTFAYKGGELEHTISILASSAKVAQGKLIYLTVLPSDWELININDDIY